MAIQINKNAIKDFAQNPMTFEFVVSDLVDIDIKASHMNLVLKLYNFLFFLIPLNKD